jgi:hypothetical protein
VSRTVSGKDIKSSYQVPLSEYVRRCADITSGAAALTIHGDQAGPTLRNNQADLTKSSIIPIGRWISVETSWRRLPDETVMVRGGFGLDPTKKPLCVWRCRARLPIHLNRG